MSARDPAELLRQTGVVLLLLLVIMGGVQDTAERALPPSFDGGRAFADLETQCAFGPRAPGTAAHESCFRWLHEALLACTPRVEVHPFEDHSGWGEKLQGKNLVAEFPGPEPTLLLAAHWDTRARADRDPDPTRLSDPVPGANDGASGVAVLVEMARMLAEAPPPRRVLVALVDMEDQGRAQNPEEFCLGSRHLAGMLHRPARAEAIVLDMVGGKEMVLRQEKISLQFAPDLVHRLWDLAWESGHGGVFVAQPGVELYDDHVSFLRAGWRAVDVVDVDYPYWHTVQDTPERCSAASLQAVGDVLRRFVYHLPAGV